MNRINNEDDFTTLEKFHSKDKVYVDEMTYGRINAITYGNNDADLYIGRFCSIAGEVAVHLLGIDDV